MKVASVINNYVHYASEKMKPAFLKLIFPKLYGVNADEAAEHDIVNENEDLETNKETINANINYGICNTNKQCEEESSFLSLNLKNGSGFETTLQNFIYQSFNNSNHFAQCFCRKRLNIRF